MISLSSTVARHRIYYPRPIPALPDVMMVHLPDKHCRDTMPLGCYYPVMVETADEQLEFQSFLDRPRTTESLPDLLDTRPSLLPCEHITIAHYGPSIEDWPYILLCRWPSILAAAALPEIGMFVRRAYTFDLFTGRNQLERASDELLEALKSRWAVDVEIVPPDWSADPRARSH